MKALRRGRLLRGIILGVLALSLAALPASAEDEAGKVSPELLAHLSQSVQLRYWAAHPDEAPATIDDGLAALEGKHGRHGDGRPHNRDVKSGGLLFNNDVLGLPQNEESVQTCVKNTDLVLSGTNDYRGFVYDGNFTGWYLSLKGDHTLTNEGLLPPVTLATGHEVPSGGDPVDAFAPDTCGDVYAASLAYSDDLVDNGIAVYKSSPSTLASCPTDVDKANPACWPVKRVVDTGAPGHFLDKEWMYVGKDWVWVTYSDFLTTGPGELDFTASIKAVRCDRSLVNCSAPMQISTVDDDVQFSDVTVDSTGRTWITWAGIQGEINPDDYPNGQEFTFKSRVETAPGSGVFGPESIIYTETKPLPFGGFLHANDFRVATVPKNDVADVNGHQRGFLVWDACRYRLLGSVCEEPVLKYAYSDDGGTTWSDPRLLVVGGDNYFPSISYNRDPKKPRLAFTYFSNRRDTEFHSRQDTMFLSMDPAKLKTSKPTTLTTHPNDTQADPILGGVFIGDYIEVNAAGKDAYVGTNANYRKVRLLFDGVPVPQQDNYLIGTSLP